MGCGNSQVNPLEKKSNGDEKTTLTQQGEQKNSKGQFVQMSKDEKVLQIQKEMYIKEVSSKDIRDDYFLERHLAQGEFGDIRIVKHKKTNQSRAMKILAKNKVIGKEQQILNEIKILSKLDHPNIIKLYEYYQDRYAYYLVFELMLGGQLIEHIQLSSFLMETESATIIQQLFSAINYCHQQNIAHLNLTPTNILMYIEEGTNKPTIKIINWFFSRQYSDNEIFTEAINDPVYKSPEEIGSSYNHLTDVWNCGIIWYTMLMGSPPFYGVNRKKTIEAIKKYKMSQQGQYSLKFHNQIKDIFSKIFVPQDKRISCEQILQHSYFKEVFQDVDKTSESYLQNVNEEKELRKKNFLQMSGYHCNSKFYQAVVNYVGFYLVGDAERQKLTEDFSKMDINKDGQLSKNEIKQGFEGFFIEDIGDIDKFLDELFDMVDSNNNGFINYNEFVSVAMDKMNLQQENKLKQAFNYFDSDQNGYITKEELVQSLTSQFNQDKSIEKMWSNIVEKGDKNKDGKISYQEFVEMLNDLC